MPNRKNIEGRKNLGFLIHAGVYLLANAGLAALNLTRNPNRLWFPWVAGGWGLGVAMHGAIAYFPGLHGNMAERKEARIERRTKRRAHRKNHLADGQSRNRMGANSRHPAEAK